jgi:hypothetical protein
MTGRIGTTNTTKDGLPSPPDLREQVARTCCYWADPAKNGTCHDAYCSHECRAVEPEKQFFDMADAILALFTPPAGRLEVGTDALDARRYRRLRVLGCAVMDTPQLDAGTVVRFTGLDEIMDQDLERYPSRGEANPHA